MPVNLRRVDTRQRSIQSQGTLELHSAYGTVGRRRSLGFERLVSEFVYRIKLCLPSTIRWREEEEPGLWTVSIRVCISDKAMLTVNHLMAEREIRIEVKATPPLNRSVSWIQFKWFLTLKTPPASVNSSKADLHKTKNQQQQRCNRYSDKWNSGDVLQ